MQLMRAQLVDSSAACGRVKADRTVADRHVLQRAPRELVHLCICQTAMSNLQKNEATCLEPTRDSLRIRAPVASYMAACVFFSSISLIFLRMYLLVALKPV
jgi:hypothetical protein